MDPINQNEIFSLKQQKAIKIQQDKENILSSTSTPVLNCSRVEGNNYSWCVTKWALYTLDGTKIYESGNHVVKDVWGKTLSELNLSIGTQLILKAVVSAGDDSTANVYLQYEPISNVTGYFLLQGNAFKTTLSYEGTSCPW